MNDFGYHLQQILLDDNLSQLEEYCNFACSFDQIFPKPTNVQYPELFISQPSILSAACYFGCYNCVHYLLSHGSEVLHEDKKRKTPFLFAVAGGSLKIIQLLIECGSNINDTDIDGNGAIHYAIKYNQKSLILYLCYVTGLDINSQNKKKETPLHFAATSMQTDVIQMLLFHGANVNAKTVV